MDIALTLVDRLPDIAVSSDIEADHGLVTAVLISLLSDRRVEAEELPPEETDRRGFWGDLLGDEGPIGSKLWLLRREKPTALTLANAKQYAEEALQWLLDDEVVSYLEVKAYYDHNKNLTVGVSITPTADDQIEILTAI